MTLTGFLEFLGFSAWGHELPSASAAAMSPPPPTTEMLIKLDDGRKCQKATLACPLQRRIAVKRRSVALRLVFRQDCNGLNMAIACNLCSIRVIRNFIDM